MIDKEHGKYILICDNCFEDIHFEDYQDVLDYIKEYQWETFKQNKEWVNYCPKCQVQ